MKQEGGDSVPNSGILSVSEFHSLKHSLQLLRISQLRYIVQKYSLPANGNKTKLLAKILEIVDTMRITPLLRTIYNEVGALVSQQNEPFFNPLGASVRIQQVALKESLCYLCNPYFQPQQILTGPFMCPRGFSSGVFTFKAPKTHESTAIVFAGVGEKPIGFEVNAIVNGSHIAALPDDPFPSPIDITDLIRSEEEDNFINITSVRSPSVLYISIVQYVLGSDHGQQTLPSQNT